MPYQRQHGVYYIKRKLGPLGKVVRSLDTRNKRTAVKREDALLDLRDMGEWELLRSFVDGRLEVDTITKKVRLNRLGELHTLLQDSITLEEAVDKTEEHAKRDNNLKVETREGYMTKLKQFHRFLSWIRPVWEYLEEGHIKASGRPTRHPGHSVRLWRQEKDEKALNDLREGVRRTIPVREALTEENIGDYKLFRRELQDRAEQTINNDLNAIARLADTALDEGWIDEKPTLSRSAYQVRMSHLGSGEIEAYLSELRPRFRLLMDVLITTGMRLGEAESLRVSDLKENAGDIYLHVETNKTNHGDRPVSITTRLARRLTDHIADENLGPRDRLFPLARRTVQKEHNRVCDELQRSAGLDLSDYTIHDHRHTAAVKMAQAGTPLHLIRQQLGHQSIESTMKYARYHPDHSEVASHLERVEKRLGRATRDE